MGTKQQSVSSVIFLPTHLRDPQCQRRLARPRSPRQQQCPPRHFSGSDEVDDEPARLPRPLLPDEAGSDGGGDAGVRVEAKALDVGVGRDARRLGRGLHLLYLNGRKMRALGGWEGERKHDEQCRGRNGSGATGVRFVRRLRNRKRISRMMRWQCSPSCFNYSISG